MLWTMDKITTPPTATPSLPPLRATVPPRASTGPDGEGLANFRSTYMEPAGMRKFAPVIVVGALAAAAMIAAGVMYDKDTPDDAALARGPAVESLVENEPTAAGPTDVAPATTDSAAPAVPAEPAPPVVAPEPTPAPAVTPRAPAAPATSNARPNRSLQSLPRPNDNDTIRPPAPDQPMRAPEPRVTEPMRTTPPAPTLEAPAPVGDTPLQPPAPEPLPTPSPVPPPVPPIQ